MPTCKQEEVKTADIWYPCESSAG